MRGLTKRFGPTLAVDALDLDVPRGSFFGLVGPNGAGKTTTLSMATGLLRPDAGSVFVLGRDVWADPVGAKRAHRRAARRAASSSTGSPARSCHYAGLLRGMDRDDRRRARRPSCSPRSGSTDAGGKLVVDYSAGMTKKVALACALVHAPAAARAGRAVRGGRPGVGRDDPAASSPASSRRGGTVDRCRATSWTWSSGICDHVAIIAAGACWRPGPSTRSAAGGASRSGSSTSSAAAPSVEGLAWLRTSSD